MEYVWEANSLSNHRWKAARRQSKHKKEFSQHRYGKQQGDRQNTRKNSVSTGMESSKETVKTQERIQSAQVWKAARRPSKHKKEFSQHRYGKQQGDRQNTRKNLISTGMESKLCQNPGTKQAVNMWGLFSPLKHVWKMNNVSEHRQNASRVKIWERIYRACKMLHMEGKQLPECMWKENQNTCGKPTEHTWNANG